jgi:DNA-binding transcriptional LysR family regulator
MARMIEWENRIGRRLRLRDLHVFFAVVQSGSMAKAAARLKVTQPSVSKAIGDLEAVLGARLFDRSPQGVEPTKCGRALLSCGTAVFDELRQGIRNIEFLTDPTAGELKIACHESIAPVLLPIFEEFSRRYPHAVLEVEEGNAPEFVQKLRDRSLDLALVRLYGQTGANYEDIDDINIKTLFDDEVIVAAGMHSRWARRRKIDLAELVDERWILTAPDAWNYKVLSEAFRKCGLDIPKIKLKTYSVHLRVNLLAAGEFVAVLPRSVLRFYADRFSLKALPVDLPVRPWPVAIVTLKNRTLSPVVERFIQCAAEVTRSMSDRPQVRKRSS